MHTCTHTLTHSRVALSSWIAHIVKSASLKLTSSRLVTNECFLYLSSNRKGVGGRERWRQDKRGRERRQSTSSFSPWLKARSHKHKFEVWPTLAEAKFASKFSKVELLALLQSFSFPHISTHNKVHIKTQSYLQFDSRDAFYFDSIGWEECIEFL